MCVLLYIKFAACIFSEHIFLRTLNKLNTLDTGYLVHFLIAFEKESIYISWKLNKRQKIFIKIFMTFLKGG